MELMRFILKMMVWSFLGLLVLPSVVSLDEKSQQSPEVSEATTSTPGGHEAITIAIGLAQDIRGICERKPLLCQAGQRVLASTMERARDGVVVLGQMVEQHRAQRRTEIHDINTGSVN